MSCKRNRRTHMPFDGVVNNTGVVNYDDGQSNTLRGFRTEDYIDGILTLQKAMRLLKSPDYWVKGTLRHRPHGFFSRKQRCILGAMIDSYANCVAYEAVCASIPPSAHHPHGWFPTIAGFNDDPKTGHTQVLAIL